MALTYDIKINGVQVDATIGVALHDKLEEALDEGGIHLPITTYNYPYKMIGLLTVNISDGINNDIDYSLLVINDSVQVMSKDGFYSHDITALEYTHKLDKMFISALSFTQPFYRKTRAQFKYLDEQGIFPNYEAFQLFPKVEFNESYFANETITIPQVGKCLTNINLGLERDVYIRSSIPGYFTAVNLTSSSRSFNMPITSGNYTFDVGFLSTDAIPQFVPIFTHYIQVVKERRYTLWDILQRIRAIVPLERESFFDATRIFDVDSSLQTSFESIEMPQLFFRQQTARQVLNTVFKYINAISRLQYVNGSRDILTVDYFNKIGLSFDENDIKDYAKIQNAQNYGSKAITFLSQTVQSNFRDNPSVTSPASNRFKTVRSSNIQLTQSSFELKLEKPIYELSKVEIVLPSVRILAQGQINSYSKTINNFTMDITHRVIEKTFWDLKNSTADIIGYDEESAFTENVGMRLNKNGNIFWERNTKSLKFDLVIGSVILETLLEEMLQEAANEELTLAAYDNYFFGSYTIPVGDLPLESPVVSLENASGLPLNNVLYRNVAFNIEYITLEDTVAQVDRLDYTENEYDSYLKINNLESVSDYQRATRDVFGKLERSSIPIKTISKIHTDLSNVLKVGQIDADGFIITERQLILHNEFIEGIYTATKDHNRLNEFNGINQQYRAFEIPDYTQVIKRKDFYNDYVFITSPNDNSTLTVADNIPLLGTTHAFRPFTHLYSNTPSSNKITYAFVKTDGFSQIYPDVSENYKAIMTPVISFGGKGGLNFTFNFESNQIAGDAILKAGSNFYNNPIRYTDNEGFFDKLWFGLGANYSTLNMVSLTNIGGTAETNFNKEYTYPLIQNTNAAALGQTFYFANGNANNPNWFNVYKDSASSYGFAYHLAIMPLDYTKYVVGQSFYLENPLVYFTETQKTMYLYVYPTLNKYNKFDDLKIKSGWSNRYVLTSSVFSYSSGLFSFLGSYAQYVGTNANWAIGDEEGNLFIASNTNANGFKILLRHLHPNLIQIGNK